MNSMNIYLLFVEFLQKCTLSFHRTTSTESIDKQTICIAGYRHGICCHYLQTDVLDCHWQICFFQVYIYLYQAEEQQKKRA